MNEFFTCKDVDGKTVKIGYEALVPVLGDQGFYLFGMDVAAICELRKQYLLNGGRVPITRQDIVELKERQMKAVCEGVDKAIKGGA